MGKRSKKSGGNNKKSNGTPSSTTTFKSKHHQYPKSQPNKKSELVVSNPAGTGNPKTLKTKKNRQRRRQRDSDLQKLDRI